MGLPKQIQKQISTNKAIEEDITKQLLEEKGPDETQSEIDQLLAEVDPDAKPTADVTELHPDSKSEEKEGDSGGDTAPKTERTDWKQKYSVLKGKYDAEVPRLSVELRDAKERLTKLEDAMLKPTPTPEEKVGEPTFTPEEIEDYGTDLLDIMGRKAREIAQKEFLPEVDALKVEVANLVRQIGATGQRIEKQEQNEVFAMLDREVKDWRKINIDPRFNEWLDQSDPFTGQTRKELMLKAFDTKHAPRVQAFFDSFLKENAAVTPIPTADPTGQVGRTVTLDLEDYVAPGTPKTSGQSSAPKEKRVWTSKEIGQFYSGVQKGHYKNRPEDKARIEADIVAATREGRVQT